MEPRIRFQGMNSASLCSLAGYIGCWAVGRGVYFPRTRTMGSRYLFKNYSASSRYELESEKKARRGLNPRLVPSFPRSSNSLAFVLVKAGRSQVYCGFGLSSTSGGPIGEATWLGITTNISYRHSWASASRPKPPASVFRQPASQSGTLAFRYRTGVPFFRYRTVRHSGI
jgi:hypothetical protein